MIGKCFILLNIYNKSNRQKIAVLENAHDITEEEKLNGVSRITFMLPEDDSKTIHCQPFNLIKWKEDGAFYRILDYEGAKSEQQLKYKKRQSYTGVSNTYEGEHVIGTLIDDVIFGTKQLDNLTTKQVIQWILNQQSTKNWVLKECDFNRKFSYSWSNENLLVALFSIPNRFDTTYQWVFNTDVYPWQISLKKLDETIPPQFYIRDGKNLLESHVTARSSEICTRIYPLGYGEGVNQLTIKDVNGGKPYLDAKPEAIRKYGIISRIWEDARFEIAQSLKDRAQVLLNGLSKPYETYSVSVADLERLSSDDMDRAKAGKIVSFDGYTTYITKVVRLLDKAGAYELELANTPQDIAGSIADLADRQRINSVYAQGATCLYSQSFNDNASDKHPAVIQFYVPSEARQINKVVLTWRLERFRAYSTAASSGGGSTTSSSAGGESKQTSSSGGSSKQTSSSGGSSNQTSSSGGGTSKSTDSGGGATQTSTSNGQATVTSGASSTSTSSSSGIAEGFTIMVSQQKKYSGGYMPAKDITKDNHRHDFKLPKTTGHTHDISHTHNLTTPSHQHNVSIPAHNHSFNVPAHNHSVSIPAHTHSVSIPSHTHSVSIPSHTHTLTLKDHTHAITYGIYEGNQANSVKIKVDGKEIKLPSGATEIDIATMLSVDGSGKIKRGTFHKIEIIPNALTRISATLSVQLFVQSEGGGNY